jgi:hypothetical protein
MPSAGIYVNPAARRAYRASTPHTAPREPEWLLVSEDSMIGMSRVRELARELKLVDDPEAIQWTGRTDLLNL